MGPAAPAFHSLCLTYSWKTLAESREEQGPKTPSDHKYVQGFQLEGQDGGAQDGIRTLYPSYEVELCPPNPT